MLHAALKPLWTVVVVIIIVAAFMLSMARLLLPLAGDYRKDIETWVQGAIGQSVEIGELDASWWGLNPSLRLVNVKLLDQDSREPLLFFKEVSVDIDILSSLFSQKIEPGIITLTGLELALTRNEDGSLELGGVSLLKAGGRKGKGEKLRKWLLSRDRLSVQNAMIHWQDKLNGNSHSVFSNLDLFLLNDGHRHQIRGKGILPENMGKEFRFAFDARGDVFKDDSWRGDFYVQSAGLKLANWPEMKKGAAFDVAKGEANFEVWGEWRNGLLQDLSGELSGIDLKITKRNEEGSSDKYVMINHAFGRVHWQNSDDGWLLNIDDLQLTVLGQEWLPTRVEMGFKKEERGDRVEVAVDHLSLSELDPLFALAEIGGKDFVSGLKEIKPRGELNNTYIRIVGNKDKLSHFFIASRFNDLSTESWRKVPGVGGMDGLFYVDESAVLLTLDVHEGQLNFKTLFRKPLALERLSGEVAAIRDGKHWRLWSDDLRVTTPDMGINSSFSLDFPGDGASPILDVVAAFSDVQISRLAHYIPVSITKPGLVKWVDRAFIHGYIPSGGVVFRGPIRRFPFKKKEGRFEARFNVDEGILDYAKGWPRLEEIEADVVINEASLFVNGESAKTLNSELSNVRARITNMKSKKRELKITGRSVGPLSDGLSYLRETPIRDTVGAAFKGLRAQGNGVLKVALRIPLNRGLTRHKVDGQLRLNNASLWHDEAGIEVKKIKGVLFSDKNGVHSKNISAVVMGFPAQVKLHTDTQQGSDSKVMVFDATGSTTSSDLKNRTNNEFLNYLEGEINWQVRLRYANKVKAKQRVGLMIRSSLQGASINLPSPLGKMAQTKRDMVVNIDFSRKDRRLVKVQYGENVSSVMEFDTGSGRWNVSRGEVRFGARASALPDKEGVFVLGKLSTLDVGAWVPVLSEVHDKQNTPAMIKSFALQIDEVAALGRKFPDVDVNAQRDSNAWNIQLASKNISGSLAIPHHRPSPILMDFNYLIVDPVDGGKAVKGQNDDPRQVRSFQLKSKQFNYESVKLGSLKVIAANAPKGLRINTILIDDGTTHINGKGAWRIDEGQQRSTFDFKLDSNDMGETLETYGYAGTIRGGKTRTTVQLEWDGAPSDFSPRTLEGKIHLSIKKGRVLEVDPGAGRIFGLLSVQALPRRLSLDFSDVFQEGFSFDKIEGDFNIKSGRAYTDSLVMDGPSARIKVFGAVDIEHRQYDQLVKVLPHITASLPLAIGVATVNPVAGVIAWLAEKIVRDPVSDLAQVTYKVTGPWEKPVVEKLSRAAMLEEESSRPVQ